jgi:hypothetical protein
MLDFNRVRRKEITLAELTAGLAVSDLRRLTDEMIDVQVGLLTGCVDADVSFVPADPQAHDSAAADAADMNLAWTLGHVIVHTTASAEESAALAAELARGVTFHGRSRSEVPWQTVTTLAQCRARLEESRRMRHASLAMWPDAPHLHNTYQPYENAPPYNAVMRFVGGLSHDDSHLKQIEEIVRQAKEARKA